MNKTVLTTPDHHHRYHCHRYVLSHGRLLHSHCNAIRVMMLLSVTDYPHARAKSTHSLYDKPSLYSRVPHELLMLCVVLAFGEYQGSCRVMERVDLKGRQCTLHFTGKVPHAEISDTLNSYSSSFHSFAASFNSALYSSICMKHHSTPSSGKIPRFKYFSEVAPHVLL